MAALGHGADAVDMCMKDDGFALTVAPRPPVRVVVADDSAIFRRAISEFLRRFQVVVLAEAADGEEALEAVARTRPDLVLMDVRMPGVDGLEAARRLKAMPGGSPHVVLVTLGNSTSLAAAAAANGADAVVSKAEILDWLPPIIGALRTSLARGL